METNRSRSSRLCSCHKPTACPSSWTVAANPHVEDRLTSWPFPCRPTQDEHPVASWQFSHAVSVASLGRKDIRVRSCQWVIAAVSPVCAAGVSVAFTSNGMRPPGQRKLLPGITTADWGWPCATSTLLTGDPGLTPRCKPWVTSLASCREASVVAFSWSTDPRMMSPSKYAVPSRMVNCTGRSVKESRVMSAVPTVPAGLSSPVP